MLNKKSILVLLLCIFCVAIPSYALNLSRVKTWGTEVLTADDLNAEFDNILTHDINNADIGASAAIVASKLDLTVGSAIGSTTPSTGAFTTLSSTAATIIGDAPADTLHHNADTITYEGATANDFELTLAITDPTADITATFPDHTGTIAVSGADFDLGAFEVRAKTLQSDQTTGTAPFTVASITAVSNLNADLLDDLEAAAFVQLTGDAAIKCWVNFNGSGVIAENDSFNLTSLTDNGAGDYTLTIATDFGSANYVASGMAFLVTAKNPIVSIVSIAAGALRISTKDFDGAAVDPTVVSVMMIGDQ